jgi:hypothetical protein
MKKDLKPLEVICSAPPYPIVEAVESIANPDGTCIFQDPKDVRWEELALNKDYDFCKLHNPQSILNRMAAYRFTYSSGDEVTYEFSQCGYCKTIYWRPKP